MDEDEYWARRADPGRDAGPHQLPNGDATSPCVEGSRVNYRPELRQAQLGAIGDTRPSTVGW